MRDSIAWVLVTMLILFFVFIFYKEMQEENKFKKFAKEHCKVIGHMKGGMNVGIGIGSNGQPATVLTPDGNKTGYQCDDGMQYWR